MPKRTIAEWLTVAKISKQIGHCFLEGPSDARVMTHLAGYPESVDFRSAQEIEIEQELDDASPLYGGFKLLLMKLAMRAEREDISNLKCLIDRDFAQLAMYRYRIESLLMTAYANLPASTFTFEWFQGFCMKGYGLLITDKDWNFLVRVLKYAFLARYLSACSSQPRAAPALSTYLTISKSVAEFDFDRYTSQYFSVSIRETKKFTLEIEQLSHWFINDVRTTINSNDLFDLAYFFLRSKNSISGTTSRDAFRQAFFASIDDSVMGQSGFRELALWIADR